MRLLLFFVIFFTTHFYTYYTILGIIIQDEKTAGFVDSLKAINTKEFYFLILLINSFMLDEGKVSLLDSIYVTLIKKVLNLSSFNCFIIMLICASLEQ